MESICTDEVGAVSVGACCCAPAEVLERLVHGIMLNFVGLVGWLLVLGCAVLGCAAGGVGGCGGCWGAASWWVQGLDVCDGCSGEGRLGVGGKKACRCCVEVVLVDGHLGAVLDLGIGEALGLDGGGVVGRISGHGEGGSVELLEVTLPKE